jgi:hypothetical protein
MAESKVLRVVLMQPFEHLPGPVGTPIVDEQEPHRRPRAGKGFERGDLKPRRFVITRNDQNDWRLYTVFLLSDKDMCIGFPSPDTFTAPSCARLVKHL